MCASLSTMPVELRLNIYDHIISGREGDLNIACCVDDHEAPGRRSISAALIHLSERMSNRDVPPRSNALTDLSCLMRVNHQFRREVVPTVFKELVAKFCIGDQWVYNFYRADLANEDKHVPLQGLKRGMRYSAYEVFSAIDNKLSRHIRDIRTIELIVYVEKCHYAAPRIESASTRVLFNETYLMLDNLFLFVEALNSSRSLKTVRLHLSFLDMKKGEEIVSCMIVNILTPFQNLALDIKLEIFHQKRDDKYRAGEFSQDALFDIIEVEHCREAKDTKRLNEEWIRLRAWLQSVLPEVRDRIFDARSDDLDTRLQRKFSALSNTSSIELRRLISEAWQFHITGQGEAFQDVKSRLIEWWRERCEERDKKFMAEPKQTLSARKGIYSGYKRQAWSILV